ncbi:MAG TPA: hypothetical protein VLN74_09490 [Ilumatobacteraceae bacterium]|nr:hypothetical protein [Ilumatobacteraceae bacterium]
MIVTPKKLTSAGGLAAVAAGLIFMLIQFVHPSENATTVTTVKWVVVSGLTATMAILATIGVSAMYLRNVRRMGVLGLVGYVLFATCFSAITAWSFVEIVVLPPVAEQTPQFVDDFLAVPGGGDTVGAVGAAKVASAITAVGYLLGGLLFGLALFRARVVARGAALLLAIGSGITVLVPVLPHAFERLLALPMGVALAALGYSLYSRVAETAVA